MTVGGCWHGDRGLDGWSNLEFTTGGRTEWCGVPVGGRIANRRVQVEDPLRPDGRASGVHHRRCVAALVGWHHAATGQLAEWCGHDASSMAGRVLTPLWERGVLRRARVEGAVRSEFVWAVNYNGHWLHDWLMWMTPEQRFEVTAGQPLVRTAPTLEWSVRHNVWVAELGLRTARVAGVAAVAGERFCRVRRVIPTAGDLEDRAADMVMVRGDGQVIVVEAVRSVDGMTRKAAWWASVLGRVESPPVVVFVAVSTDTPRVRELRGAFRKAVGSGSMRERRRMVWVEWAEWFDDQAATDRFAVWSGRRLTSSGEWASVDVLDPTALPLLGAGRGEVADRLRRGGQHPVRKG